ncbi:matrixin family metalloprotease [Pseudoalteromonas galatheae]|uniref:matrixin family metalloprotease n=1 Tax=Pseudoalteromonas galatheae TaxID=579562 RepID=UPI0030CD9287
MKIANWICLLLFLVIFPAFGGSPNWQFDSSNQPVPVKWDANNQPYVWSLNESGYPPLEFNVLEQKLREAFATWQTLPDSNVTFSYGGTTPETGKGRGSALGPNIDGYNVISFANTEHEFPEPVLAVCSSTSISKELEITDDNADLNGDGINDIPIGFYPAGTIFDADIFFDGAKVFSDQLVYNVALHEIGHCIGLAHSSLPYSTMYPTQDTDIERGSLLKADDISTLASYMGNADTKTRYGRISGQVLDGVSGRTITGAHVIAVDSDTKESIVGTYSLTNGQYDLFVPIGKYFLKIEPLDSSHVGLEAERLNILVTNPDSTFFEREYYDPKESSYEEGAEEPLLFDVTAGIEISDINFYINQKATSEFKFPLKKGLNYFGYPQLVPFGLTSYDLLSQVSQFIEVNRIERFNTETGGFEFAFMLDGQPQGVEFDIQSGEGYLIASESDGELVFPGGTYCHQFTLKKGLNLVSITCPPSDFDSYQMLEAIGSSETVESIRYYDSNTKAYREARYEGGVIVGDRFDLPHGVALEVRMLVDSGTFQLSKQEISAPIINYISPGVTIPRGYVLISGEGFTAEVGENIVLAGNKRLAVQNASHNSLLVQIPNDIEAGEYMLSVTVNGLKSNEATLSIMPNQVLENSESLTQLLSGMKVRGGIDALGEQDVYTFVALAGSKVNIQLLPLQSRAKLGLQMLNPNGGMLLHRKASVGGTYIAVQNFEIEATGIYTLVISSEMVSAYQLSIDIDAPTGSAKTSVLLGEGQTAVKGTELAEPILLLITDKRGQPVANADVVLTQKSIASEEAKKLQVVKRNSLKKNESAPRPAAANAGLTDTQLESLKSDSYGMVAVKVAAPNLVEDFQLRVSVPGIPDIEPILLTVKVISAPVAKINIEKTEQNCGSQCPVGEVLPDPWAVTFLDAQGNGIKDLRVDWLIVSGEGKLGKSASSTTKRTLQVDTDENGKVEVYHKLGDKLYVNGDNSDISNSLVKIPQIAMMAIPGQSAPVIFTAEAKAGAVSRVISSSLTDLQGTMYTQSFNALGLIAKDAYGNPVSGAEVKVISPTPDSGIEILPGDIHGVPINGFRTNNRGIWLADIKMSEAIPTIDEFGNKDTQGLAETYVINLQIGSKALKYKLDIDMGPILLTQKSDRRITAIVGQPLEEEISFKPHGFMRNSQSEPLTRKKAMWNDVMEWKLTGEGYRWEGPKSAYARDDITRIKDFTKVMPTHQKADDIHFSVLNYADEGTEMEVIDSKLVCEEDKDIWQCRGEDQVHYYAHRAGKVKVTNVGDFYANQPVFVKAVIPEYRHGIFVGDTYDTRWGIVRETYYKDLTGYATIYPKPIQLSFVIEDPFVSGSDDLSSYPGIGNVSGIDLQMLNITMPNGTVINASNLQDSIQLNQSPNFAQLWLDHHQIGVITEEVLHLKPEHMQLIYSPKASELNKGSNTFKLSISDASGNSAAEASCTFTYPTSIKCQE